MKLTEKLSAIVSGLPEEASVTLPSETIRAWLAESVDEWTAQKNSQPVPEEDHLLTVDGVAEILAVDRAWVYRQAETFPFRRKLSSGTLRFSADGLQRWLKTRQ